MKKICIDTNFNYLGPIYPIITIDKVKKNHLIEEEEIILVMESEAWKGIVKFDDKLPEYAQ